MSTSDITLSAPTRTNLLSLTRTSRLIGRTQERLSTGLKVNSALDDALAFFQSRGLSNRSSDLAALKNSIDQGISTVKAAVQGAEALADLVDQAKGSRPAGTSDQRYVGTSEPGQPVQRYP